MQCSAYPFRAQPYKMVRHTQIIYRVLPTNYLNMFDHFVGLPVKGLLGSYLDMPEQIVMTTPCQIIPSFEVAINKMCSCQKKYLWDRTHFQVNLRSEASYQDL